MSRKLTSEARAALKTLIHAASEFRSLCEDTELDVHEDDLDLIDESIENICAKHETSMLFVANNVDAPEEDEDDE